MRVTCFSLTFRASVLACLAGLASIPAWADEEKTKAKTESKSKSQSSTAQVEVRVERSKEDGKSDSERDQQQVTVVLGGTGDPSDVVKAAIEKLEKQLKGSGIPESLQQKALESLRSQLDQQAAGGKAFSGTATWSSGQQSSQPQSGGRGSEENAAKKSKEKNSKQSSEQKVQSNSRFEVRLPFGRIHQEFASTMGPAQKKKLRNAISEALEQSGIASDVIEKALGNVDKSLDEIGSPSNSGWTGSEKLPYRVGIGCKLKEAGDTTPGLEVETVFEESPAAKAGLKPGDRLISIDKQPIQTHDDIVSAVQKAGDENRSIQLEAIRDEVSATYEMKPQQTAVAELNIEMFPPRSMNLQPGGNPGFTFPGQAWVMPQWTKDGPLNNSKLQDQNEKNVDEMRRELSGVHKDLEEIKDALKKLSEKQ